MRQKIYIGYDPREHQAYDVARHSIVSRTDPKTIQVIPLELKNLTDILTRPIERRDGKLWCPISQAPMATEFAISRFAIPILQKKGWVLFVDCDIVCLADIAELFNLVDPQYAVMVVKHNYIPAETVKMVDQTQTFYARKNWSSVVLWNCEHPANTALTLEVLNTWPGRDLHAFKWLKDEEIGALPPAWNHLVGCGPDIAEPKILHFTLGGPWLKDWQPQATDAIWLNEAKKLETAHG